MFCNTIGHYSSFLVQIFKEQNDLIDTDTEFFVRDRNNIEDFLYEMNGDFINKNAAKKFDSLDMIFIGGDQNLRPWSESALRVGLFLAI